MATERINIVVSEDGSRTVKRNLEEVGSAGSGAAKGVNILKSALAGLGVGISVTQLVRLADGYSSLLNRLRLVTDGTANLAAVNDSLFASANRTRSSYEATAELYSSLARSSKGLGLSQTDLLGVTDTLNQAMRVSGADGQTAAAGLRQLGQALGSGVLRGDELNSVLENTPRLATAIADGMGVTIGQLRALGAEGKLTSQQIVQAVQSQAPEIAAEFGRMTPTVGESLTVLHNNLLRFVGELDQATGVSAALANGLIFLSQHLGTVAVLAGTVGAALIWPYAVGAIQGVAGAVRGLNLALLANPFVAIVAVVALAVAALVEFGDRVSVTSDGAVTLKDAFFGALSLIGDLVRTVAAAFLTAWDTTIGAVTGFLASFGVSWSDIFSAIWTVTKAVINGVIGVFVFAWNMVKAAWNNFPGFMDIIFTSVLNLAAEAAEAVLNAWQMPLKFISRGLSIISDDAGAALDGFLGATKLTVPRAKLSAAGREAGSAMAAGATAAFTTDYLGNAGAAIIERARTLGGEMASAVADGAASQTGAGTAVADAGKDRAAAAAKEALETRAGYLAKISYEAQSAIVQARVFDSELRKVDEAVSAVNAHLLEKNWSVLNPKEEQELRDLVKLRDEENRLMKVRDGILEASRGPAQAYEDHLKASKQLLDQNLISMEEFIRGHRAAAIALLETQNTVAAGFELGKLTVQADNDDNVTGRVASAYAREYQAANGPMKDLQERAGILKQLMQDDPVNSGTYASALRETGLEALILKGSLPDATVFDGMRAGLARFAQDFRGILPGLGQAWGQWAQKIGDGFADAIGRAIVYGENLEDALLNVAQSAMAELISSLVKLGVQWLIMQVIGQGAQAALTASAAAAGATTAAAWAPAAAMASLATLGANAGLAAAGISMVTALASALALPKGFREGGYTGGMGVGEVAGVVHGQEFVVNAKATRRWFPMLDAMNSGAMPGYASGGYVGRKPSASSSMFMGSGGGVSPAPAVGGVTIEKGAFQIDARGAEHGVEEKIDDALRMAVPYILEKASKQEDKKLKNRSGRQRIGG